MSDDDDDAAVAVTWDLNVSEFNLSMLLAVLLRNFCVRPVSRDGIMIDSPPSAIRMARVRHSFLMIGTGGANEAIGSFFTMCTSSLVSSANLKETFFFFAGTFLSTTVADTDASACVGVDDPGGEPLPPPPPTSGGSGGCGFSVVLI